MYTNNIFFLVKIPWNWIEKLMSIKKNSLCFVNACFETKNPAFSQSDSCDTMVIIKKYILHCNDTIEAICAVFLSYKEIFRFKDLWNIQNVASRTEINKNPKEILLIEKRHISNLKLCCQRLILWNKQERLFALCHHTLHPQLAVWCALYFFARKKNWPESEKSEKWHKRSRNTK